MNLDEKLTEMEKCFFHANALMDRFRQPYIADFSPVYKQSILDDIEHIQCSDIAQELQLNTILKKIKDLLGPPITEKTYAVISQIIFTLYDIIQKWYFMTVHDENTYNEILLENYFDTQYPKNALIIYILHPFLFPGLTPHHTNQLEAMVMAEILSERGYNVDIINVQYTGKVIHERYDLIIGFGPRFDEICHKHKNTSLAICYLTESSPYFSNIAELRRIRDFQKRNGCLLSMERQSSRMLDLSALIKADAAICLGNQQTLSTYEGMFDHIYSLNVSGFSDFPLPSLRKDYEQNRKNFLWYGGAGPLHKGLDLCIEAFRALPFLNLFIVGEVTAEFYHFYEEDFENSANIFYYGFLNKDSEDFGLVSEQCGFCLFPSCSEGQSTAVVTTMFSGILPVCTKETGIDVQAAGGFLIDDIKIGSLISLIRKLSELDKTEFTLRQQKVYRYAIEHHTIKHYREQLNKILKHIVDNSSKHI